MKSRIKNNIGLLAFIALALIALAFLFTSYKNANNQNMSGKACMALTDEEVAQKCKGLTGQALKECIIECTTNSPVYNDENIND